MPPAILAPHVTDPIGTKDDDRADRPITSDHQEDSGLGVYNGHHETEIILQDPANISTSNSKM